MQKLFVKKLTFRKISRSAPSKITNYMENPKSRVLMNAFLKLSLTTALFFEYFAVAV